MKINPTSRANVLKAYKTKNKNKVAVSKKDQSGVKVELSKDALAFKEAQKASEATKLADTKKLDALKEKVKDGSYHVDSKDIAMSIVKKAIRKP